MSVQVAADRLLLLRRSMHRPRSPPAPPLMRPVMCARSVLLTRSTAACPPPRRSVAATQLYVRELVGGRGYVGRATRSTMPSRSSICIRAGPPSRQPTAGGASPHTSPLARAFRAAG